MKNFRAAAFLLVADAKANFSVRRKTFASAT